MNLTERAARMGLCALGQPAEIRLSRAVAEVGAVELWQRLVASTEESVWPRRARVLNLDDIAAATKACGARFIIPSDEEWPTSLDDLDSSEPVGAAGGAPVGLWVKGVGHLAEWSSRAVAMVGARASTHYGEQVSADIAAELSSRGWTVVSGGAYGIDAASHRGALAVQGRTLSVVNNGLDVNYPAGNSALLRAIVDRGVVVSEVQPGQRPTKPGFLARNRLIAALSVGVVVVEAAARSGARNTAAWGGALGRVVMAVPGPVHSGLSETPHRLIRDGEATLVASALDVLALVAPIGLSPELPINGPQRPIDSLSATQLAVREQLPARGALSAGEVSMLTGFDLRTCLTTLHELESGGWVAHADDGAWRLVLPSALRPAG